MPFNSIPLLGRIPSDGSATRVTTLQVGQPKQGLPMQQDAPSILQQSLQDV